MWPLTGVAALATLISGNKVKLVASEHIDFCATSSRKWIERLFLKRFGRYIYSPCRHIIAVSQGVAESLKIAAGLRPDRITVIHNPIGDYLPSEIGEDDRHMLSGWLDANDRLIAIGRLADQKRFDVLLRSFAEVRRQRNARLLILGEGPLREQLQELARNLGVAEVVWMPGFRQNPATFLQHAKVFVLSSDYEGLGNVIIEALAGGVPVVSTDCPSGPNEILENGKYGLLVPVGDHYEMSKAILRLLETQPNKKELMHRAEHFTPDAKAKSYLELLLGEKTF
jgi:glycosyltransferase involved in cell wall biosynthesis